MGWGAVGISYTTGARGRNRQECASCCARRHRRRRPDAGLAPGDLVACLAMHAAPLPSRLHRCFVPRDGFDAWRFVCGGCGPPCCCLTGLGTDEAVHGGRGTACRWDMGVISCQVGMCAGDRVLRGLRWNVLVVRLESMATPKCCCEVTSGGRCAGITSWPRQPEPRSSPSWGRQLVNSLLHRF